MQSCDIQEQTANNQMVQCGSINLSWPLFFDWIISHVCHEVTTVLDRLHITNPINSRGHPHECHMEMANIVMKVCFFLFLFFFVFFFMNFQPVSPGFV